jgi:lysophospholipase L1-like esterase
MPSQPQKSQIRAWGTWLENLTSSLGLAVSSAYIRGSYAQLVSVVDASTGDVGIVVADDDEDLRGIYVRAGSTWLKKFDLPVDAAALVLEQTENARDLALTYRDQARTARDTAANYRDQAAAYVNDITSEKEVPIFGTVAGMSAIGVPVGILTIRVLGRQAMGDTDTMTWVRVPNEPDVAPNAKFRSTDRFLPNGTSSSSNGGWWQIASARPKLELFTGAWTPQQRLDYLAARMAAGEAIKVACYGDSTTDGNQTTGWTANPVDGSGDAVGTTNHASTAPNAWPAALQTILRAMHGNNGIVCWNAGYSGKRITDGWAYRNFEKAIVSNPEYGVPDVVIIGFGLNDQPLAGSQNAVLTAEMRKLAQKAMAYGAVPVFLTCDAAPSHTSSRDNREQSRQVDATKIAVCAELSIPILEMGRALDRWASGNSDGYRWREQQTDYLHFGDAGHSLKAGFIAKHFYRDTVEVEAGKRRIVGTWSSELNSGHPDGTFDTFTSSNGRFAGNWIIPRGAMASGDVMADCWVWCESAEASAVYRGFDGDVDNEYANGLTDGSYFQIWSPITGTRTARPSSTGFKAAANGYRRADMPAVLGKLNWGLNRITYKAGAALATGVGNSYVGWLDLMPFDAIAPRSALKKFGRFTKKASAGTGAAAFFLPEAEDGSNLWGFPNQNGIELFAHVVLPVGCGLIYGWSPGFGDSGQISTDKSFGFLYRFAANTLRVYSGRTINGVVSFPSNVGQGTISTTDELKLRLRLDRSGDNQVFSVYDGFGAASPAITVTTAYNVIPLPFGGVAGGLFFNMAEITGTALAEIISLTIAP